MPRLRRCPSDFAGEMKQMMPSGRWTKTVIKIETFNRQVDVNPTTKTIPVFLEVLDLQNVQSKSILVVSQMCGATPKNMLKEVVLV